jgi:hypothetical protein
MNRREFGKAALGVAAASFIGPVALAAAPRSIVDTIVIDYQKPKRRWRLLKEPDFEGHKFVYEDTDETESYRHFQFLGSDGLVVGESAEMKWWPACYDSLEDEFLHSFNPPAGKRFSHDEFRHYVEEVREYFNGRIITLEEMTAQQNNS